MTGFLNSPAGVALIVGIFGIILAMIFASPIVKAINRLVEAKENENRIGQDAHRTRANDLREVRNGISDEISAEGNRVYAAVVQLFDATVLPLRHDIHTVADALDALAHTMGLDPQQVWPGQLETPDTRPRSNEDGVKAAVTEPTQQQPMVETRGPGFDPGGHEAEQVRPANDGTLAETPGWTNTAGEQDVSPPETHTERLSFPLRGWLNTPQGNFLDPPFDFEDFSAHGRALLLGLFQSRCQPGKNLWDSYPGRYGHTQYDVVRALLMQEYDFAFHSCMEVELPMLRDDPGFRTWLAEQPEDRRQQ